MGARNISIFAIAFSLGLGTNALADSRVKTKFTSAGQSTETTVYTKDSRQRLDTGGGMAMINQCDQQKSIQLFEQRKSYMIFPAGDPSHPAESAESSKGGTVTYTVNVTDTGEKKTIFGFTARHMKSVTTKEADANSCNPGRETMESDGWYIDYEPEAPMCLANTTKIQAPPHHSGCNDEIKVNQTGEGKLGYPVSYTLKTTTGDGAATVTEMQIVEFSTATLDKNLFEIPAGYTEMQSPTDFSAALGAHSTGAAALPSIPAGPKNSATVRVGVADISNHTSSSAAAARDQLIAALTASKIEAIPLQGQSPAEIEEAAKKYEADYVLYAELAELKKSSGGLGKFGGMLSKASVMGGGGAASTKEKVEAKVNYKLVAPGGSKPVLSASLSGSNGGGFGLGSALNLAANVTPMAMFMKMGLFNPNMMRMLGTANGFGGGAVAIPGMPRGGLAPGMGSFMPMLQATQALMGPSTGATEESKAVADAFNETAKGIAEALKKRK